jgi:N-acetylmuramoyl-L-alanine amidase
MSTFKPLKILASRRQVLKAGLAAITLSGSPHRPARKNNSH